MNPTPQTGKRIVSKGEYAKVQSRKMWGLLLAGGLIVIEVSLMGVVGWGLLNGITIQKIIVGTYLIMISFAANQAGKYYIKRSHAIEPVVPLTRANAADLPAPDSLGRASEQPTSNPQSELLRAAAQGESTPAEQLLRPID